MAVTPQSLFFVIFTAVSIYVLFVFYKAFFELVLLSVLALIYKCCTYLDDEMLQISVWLSACVVVGILGWVKVNWERLRHGYRR